MVIGEVFRYARPYSSVQESIDGLPNFFYRTHSPGANLPLLDSGINPIGKIGSPDGLRCPAVLISSSPHKIGSRETPWQDFFDPDNGHVHYYGDNKDPGANPASPKGNKALLEQFKLHSSPRIEDRLVACPIVVFRRVSIKGRPKGNVQFQGFGIISRAERVTQFDRKENRPFVNYAFDFTLFELSAENEIFNWDWITKRRDRALSSAEVLECAPESWRRWVNEGHPAIERCRRRVVKLLTVSSEEQKADLSARESGILRSIYEYYRGKKSRFEALAAFVTARVLTDRGGAYRSGWITPSTSDGGADFVGRLDIGSGLASAKIIVLGQAKCEKLNSPTGGNHIARTVARLKRGWIGAYVTTSYFSEAVQREVLEDKYPILLINGTRVAKEVNRAMHQDGISELNEFLDLVDKTYDSQVMQRQPEELLLEA